MVIGMATFHVYVEGAVDGSPDGVRRLAQAISQRYGLPATDLMSRLGAGRFRVKANVDKVTAETYQRALQEVGARVTIEEALERAKSDVSGRTSSSSMPPMNLRGSTTPPPRAQVTTPPRGQVQTPAARPPSSMPPANRPATPALGTPQRSGASLPPTNAPRTSQPASGLAAAFGARAQSESGFEALGSGALSLSSVDGNEESPEPAGAAFAPPPEPVAVSLAPEPPKPVATKPKTQPLDLFAPPEAEEAEAKVELATDEIEHRAKKMSTPPVSAPVASTPNTPAMRRSSPSIPVPSRPAISSAEMPRGRFAAGVLLSILIGFVPAHFVAAMREDSAFQKIDAQITATQNNVEDEEGYRALDGFRAAQLSKKKSERNTIAWQSLLIWAVVGAGAAYVYFRRIPWSKPDAA